MLQAEGLTWRMHERAIVDGVSLHVDAGECVGLLGPNGCGKSSLLRLLYRAVRPHAGRVTLQWQDIWALSPRAFAQRTAVMAQREELAFDCSVREAVMMGRTPHQSPWARDSADDVARVRACLQRVDAWELAEQRLSTLSGGELQRVRLARALVQEPQLLFLDEPTNHLDIRHQLELLRQVRELSRTALIVMHDINLAARFCTRLYLMDHGRLVADGSAEQVLTPERLRAVYGVHAAVDRLPATGQLRVSCW